jgi:hypothetical protein
VSTRAPPESEILPSIAFRFALLIMRGVGRSG